MKKLFASVWIGARTSFSSVSPDVVTEPGARSLRSQRKRALYFTPSIGVTKIPAPCPLTAPPAVRSIGDGFVRVPGGHMRALKLIVTGYVTARCARQRRAPVVS